MNSGHEYLPGIQWQTQEQSDTFAKSLVAEGIESSAVGSLAVGSLASAMAVSDIVVTATNATAPLLQVQHFDGSTRKSTLIIAVGSYRPDMAELSIDLVRTANRPIVVDSVEGAMHEAGDLLQAGITRSDLLALADIESIRQPGDGITIFKSVGNALWDLAACRAVYQLILET